MIPVIITVVTARYSAELVNKKGIFEIVMGWNQFPYLSLEEKPRYDAFKVKEIVQKPVTTLNTTEKAYRLVTLLRESTHNGFPVVNDSGKLLGLVRRDQIVALIEFGVFDEDKEDADIEDPPSRPSSEARRSSNSNLPDSAMMHLAYHIKDDQYEFVENGNGKKGEQGVEGEGDVIVWRRENKHSVDTTSSPASETSALLTSANPSRQDHDHDNGYSSTTQHPRPRSQRSGGSTLEEDGQPAKFATVSKSANHNLYISWLDPEYGDKYVNLAQVMNQGVYCVTEFCPISKARTLFTGLGLRHVVVTGGPSGGDVVGILTRASFLDAFIRQRTGA